jgi:hypothetical protein
VSEERGHEGVPGRCAPDCVTCTHLRRGALEAAAALGVRALDATAIASAAGVPVAAVERHGPGSVAGWVADAYRESTQGLQRDFELDLMPARTWADGVRWATEGLVRTLISDPERARFSYVEVLQGDEGLRILREEVRRRSVEIFTRAWVDRHGLDQVAPLKMELACNVIIHAIGSHARDGRMADLAGELDAVFVAAGAR